MKKFPIVLFLPIPVLLLLAAGCTPEVVDAPDAPIITINETPDNMTIINGTNMSDIVANETNVSVINDSEVSINVTNTSTQYTVASETA